MVDKAKHYAEDIIIDTKLNHKIIIRNSEKSFGVTKKNNYFLFLPPPLRGGGVDFALKII